MVVIVIVIVTVIVIVMVIVIIVIVAVIIIVVVVVIPSMVGGHRMNFFALDNSIYERMRPVKGESWLRECKQTNNEKPSLIFLASFPCKKQLRIFFTPPVSCVDPIMTDTIRSRFLLPWNFIQESYWYMEK